MVVMGERKKKKKKRGSLHVKGLACKSSCILFGRLGCPHTYLVSTYLDFLKFGLVLQ